MEYSHPDAKWFAKRGLTPPTVQQHGTEEDIRANLKSAKPTNWRMEGNQLHADTEFGPLVQTIRPDHILTGTDTNGLPIFKKV